MLIFKIIVVLCVLVGLIMIGGCWIGFIINSFKEGEQGWGFFALGLLLISLAWLAAQLVP